MRKVSKIIILRDDSFLFAVKRAPHEPMKDGKLELLGGGVDRGETPLQALVRELTEEEGSSLLAHKVASVQLIPVNFVVEGDSHFIYHLAVTEKELKGIQISSDENYGFHLIPKSIIMADHRLDRKVFTPRTVKIFEKLKRLRYFPYDTE